MPDVHRFFEGLRAFTLTILEEGGPGETSRGVALLRGPWINGRERVVAGDV